MRLSLAKKKMVVARDISSSLNARRSQASLDEETNCKLFSQFLPDSVPVDSVIADDVHSMPIIAKKRGVSSVVQQDVLTKISKRMSTLPALASVQRVVGEGHIASPS